MKTMIVNEVEKQEGRTLPLAAPHKNPRVPDYYAIASVDCSIKVGDTIEYEPEGVNFGWFIKKVE